jgi:hypothetical protein
MTKLINESNTQVSGMYHEECGSAVAVMWFWWPEQEVWESMPVCLVHGGPLSYEEVELINDNS